MKTCFKCGETKPLEEFYKHPQMADGHLNKCKACARSDVQRDYQENREAHREYEHKRQQTAERRRKKLEYQRKARTLNAAKAKARYTTSNAIRDGKLIPQPCEVCGEIESQAHHEDYSKPLEVRWLCFKHHRETHGQTVG